MASLTQQAVDAGSAGAVWGVGVGVAYSWLLYGTRSSHNLVAESQEAVSQAQAFQETKAEAATPSFGSHTVTSITFYWCHGTSLDLLWEGNNKAANPGRPRPQWPALETDYHMRSVKSSEQRGQWEAVHPPLASGWLGSSGLWALRAAFAVRHMAEHACTPPRAVPERLLWLLGSTEAKRKWFFW